MAVKVRLMRIGAKGRPFYRVVAVDERKKRTGSYLELLGTYNPLTTPKEIILKQDRIDAWVKNGAQLSDGFLRIIGKAKQRVPRKPKKDKGGNDSTTTPPAPASETEKVDENAADETSEAVTENTEISPEVTPETSEKSSSDEATESVSETSEAASENSDEVVEEKASKNPEAEPEKEESEKESK